ncbi:hypothetical protein LINPERHAP1_LOCUS10237 [Linum perenne]
MPPRYEITLHHSGVMDLRGDELVYVGGTSQTIYMDKEELSYFQLKQIGTRFVLYKLVQGIWYLEPNKAMGLGLHQIRNDTDVTNGLLASVGDDLTMTLFMTGYCGPDDGPDNEGGTIGSPVQDDIFSKPENPIGHEFMHLVDDELRTSDDEFEDALFTMGIRTTRNKVAYMDFSSGDDVEQQFEPDSVSAQPHGIGLEGPQPVDSGSEADSESSRYSSDRLAHVRNLVSDEEAPEDIYDDAPVYNPSCDHKHLQFQLGMKFKSPTQFKHAVVKHAIYAGANLIWTRSGKKRCEAICRESTCKWRIYGYWYRVSKSFMELVAALNQLMPYAEHRKCARHVFANWKTKHTGDALREGFWQAIYSCNEADWNHKMRVLEILEHDEPVNKKPFQDSCLKIRKHSVGPSCQPSRNAILRVNPMEGILNRQLLKYLNRHLLRYLNLPMLVPVLGVV